MKSPGWAIIILLTAIPLIIWATVMPLAYRFTSLPNTTTSFGQLSGIAGMTLFSLAMVLSIRLSLFDKLFGGLNRAYIVHHQIGGIAFLLLMLHPLLLSVIYLVTSVTSAALFLLPGGDWTINFGIAALLTLMGLLIFTYYVDLPYQWWRFTHKFMGVAFVFGVIHAFFVPSDIANYPVLRFYMFTIMSLGVMAYIYKTLLGKFFVPHYRYAVNSIKKRNDSVIEMILTPLSEKILVFEPGQFVFIEFAGRKILSEMHPFSISSKPAKEGFALTIKALGDFTRSLEKVTAGQEVRVEGPFGRFSPTYFPSSTYVWLAGGIGITPFVSMARSLSSNTTAIDLYYLVRTANEMVFSEELAAISKQYPQFRFIPWYSKSNGHLTGEHILKYTPDVAKRDIFLCGPPAMMVQMKKELRRIGVSKSKIHSEEFFLS